MQRTTLMKRFIRRLRQAARFLIPRRESAALSPPSSAHRLRSETRPDRRSVRQRRWNHTGVLRVVAVMSALSGVVQAATIYVDNRFGNDRLDGQTATQVSDHSGPVRTLRRAVRLVEAGDQIELANTGEPYVGGLALYGIEQSGVAGFPIVIQGNGAVITGAKPIDPTAWRLVRGHIWRITPVRKGWYQLVLDGKAVPETECPADAIELPELPVGNWCAWNGAIYYHSAPDRDPLYLPLQLADEQTGLTLVAVEDVVIRDVEFRHFREDGVHLHDRCRNIVLENVTCRENGRAGIVVRGTSEVVLRNPTLVGNRRESLLIEGLGVADVEGGTLDREPTVRTSVAGSDANAGASPR